MPVDVRIIAATNRDLQQEVTDGKFREDLYYRLNVVSLTLPALRERPEDIPLLAQFFLERFAKKNNKIVRGFTPGAMDRLIRYAWPGNVRELENAIERAVVLLIGEHIGERELPGKLLKSFSVERDVEAVLMTGLTLEEVERTVIAETLKKFCGNKSETAKALGINRKTLHMKLAKYCTD